MSASRSGAHVVVESLQALGCEAMFGVPGGQTLPFYAAAHEVGMRHVLMRDERSAACAADAYSRLSGRVGVCDATVGPGATNLVSGLAEALQSGTPVLALVADLARGWDFLRPRGVASQALDQRAMLAPVTKWVVRADAANTLEATIDQAVRVATGGRPGPVAVEIPEDLLGGEAGDQRFSRPLRMVVGPPHRSSASAEEITSIVKLLAACSRPVVLAGGGVLASGASDALARLSAAWRMPVVTTINGKGAIAETERGACGVTGVFGTDYANQILGDADVVMVIGSKLGQFGSFEWRLPASDQRVVHIDIDGDEIGRTTPCELGVVADARNVVEALLECASGDVDARWWHESIARTARDIGASTVGEIHPALAVRIIDDFVDDSTIVVSDASLASGWVSQEIHTRVSGRTVLAPRGLAGIGWAGGAAIGAAIARPEHRIISVAGDGAWAYTMAEVETASRLGSPITFVVLNNAGLGWINHIERRIGRAPRSTFTRVDFAAAGSALGAHGVRVTTAEELSVAIAEASADGPTVIDVATTLDVSPIARPPKRGGATNVGSVYVS